MVEASQSIGDVVHALVDEFPDVSISKVRYLESKGLITPNRAPSGYRKYSDVDIKQLRWVLRQQRDHFLPLKVIKEKLSTGDHSLDQAEPAVRTRRRAVTLDKPAVDLQLSREELQDRTGLSDEHLTDLERFGLLDPLKANHTAVFSGEDLLVAQLAASFLEHGVEPRHLRPWKVATDREAGLVDQRLASIGDDPADRRSTVADLIGLGDDLRSVLLRRALTDDL